VFLTIVAIVIAVVLALVVVLFLRREDEQPEEPYLNEWAQERVKVMALIEAVEKGDQNAGEDLLNLPAWSGRRPTWSLHNAEVDRYNKAEARAKCWREYRTVLPLLRKARARCHPDGDFEPNNASLRQILGYFANATSNNYQRFVEEIGLTKESAQSWLQGDHEQLRGELLAATLEGDRSAFHRLRKLLIEAKKDEHVNLKFPDEWHEFVAKHLWNPSLDDFVHRGRDPEPGALRWRAAAVLGSSPADIVEAKLILAYCNYGSVRPSWAQLEIGTFAERIAELVVRYDLERGLIEAEATA
jgi:hypothetical protein